MKHLATLLFALSLLGGAAPVAVAKPLSKILAQSGMSPQDFDMMAAAERSLYETSAPKAGKTASWANPETGSNGTVRVDAVQGNCVDLQSRVIPKGTGEEVTLKTRMCKSAEGKWLLTL